MYSDKESISRCFSKVITKMLIYFIISIIIFYPFNPKFIAYILFMFSIWIILSINYKINKNSEVLLSAIIFSIINLTSLIFTKCFIHKSLHTSSFNIGSSLIYLIYLMIILFKCVYIIKKFEVFKNEDESLFNRRKYDLIRVKDFIESVDTVGINGAWGSGKTFLINELKKDVETSGNYVFIDIDLLSCNLDELQTILLNEMEKILSEHKIIPTYSNKLKNIFNKSAIHHFLYMLFIKDDPSYSESLNGFKEEIDLLNKTIVIVYEDIDRISNTDTIKKIFSISEKLSNTSKNIKIIYQYEYENLQKEELDREYLEKYIPYVVNLTPISFKEVLENVLGSLEINENILSVKDFDHIHMPIFSDYYFEEVLQINYVISIKLENIPTRKVEIFIGDLLVILNRQELFKEKDNKRTAINFIFIKHFFPKIYNQFSLDEGLLDTIKLYYKEEDYTLSELIAMMKLYEENRSDSILNRSDFKSLFNEQQNKEALALLSFFDYNIDISNGDKTPEETVSELPQNIIKKEANDKKDKLIWNLLCNGKSEYTDAEAITNKLIKDVLYKDTSEQKNAYQNFSNEIWNGNYEKRDNETIFYVGISEFVSLSQALRVSNVTSEIWKEFLKLYFDYNKNGIISIELIQVLSYCSLTSKELYLYILDEFNSLKIDGNMNTNKSYRRFIKEYLRAISSLGYVNTFNLGMLEIPNEVLLKSSNIKDAVHYIKKDISDMRSKIDIKKIQIDLDTIISFIDKNIEISECENILKIEKLEYEDRIGSSYTHQEEFDRLSELKPTLSGDGEEFKKLLEKSYEDGFIYAYEVEDLLEI